VMGRKMLPVEPIDPWRGYLLPGSIDLVRHSLFETVVQNGCRRDGLYTLVYRAMIFVPFAVATQQAVVAGMYHLVRRHRQTRVVPHGRRGSPKHLDQLA
jgi:hypothetical protein